MAKTRIEPFGSAVEFAQFGRNVMAYVRPVRSDDINRRYSEGPTLPEGLDLWGLFTADGQPIAIADEPAALESNAAEMDLKTLQRH